MRKKIELERQRLKEVKAELADAEFIERRIQEIKDELVASASGPLPQLPNGKRAALMAMGKRADGSSTTWRDICPKWISLSDQQIALKAQ
jgi:hypothetical protein